MVNVSSIIVFEFHFIILTLVPYQVWHPIVMPLESVLMKNMKVIPLKDNSSLRIYGSVDMINCTTVLLH